MNTPLQQYDERLDEIIERLQSVSAGIVGYERVIKMEGARYLLHSLTRDCYADLPITEKILFCNHTGERSLSNE